MKSVNIAPQMQRRRNSVLDIIIKTHANREWESMLEGRAVAIWSEFEDLSSFAFTSSVEAFGR